VIMLSGGKGLNESTVLSFIYLEVEKPHVSPYFIFYRKDDEGIVKYNTKVVSLPHDGRV